VFRLDNNGLYDHGVHQTMYMFLLRLVNAVYVSYELMAINGGTFVNIGLEPTRKEAAVSETEVLHRAFVREH
jgi:hypothetical protein